MLVIYCNISRVIDTILLGLLVGYMGNDYPIVIFLLYDVSPLEEKKWLDPMSLGLNKLSCTM
jgi:hypothetical protein